MIKKLTGNPLSLALLRVETDFRSTVALKASWDGLCLCIRVPLCANSARLRLADTSSNVWKGTAASNSSLAEAMSAEISSLTSWVFFSTGSGINCKINQKIGQNQVDKTPERNRLRSRNLYIIFVCISYYDIPEAVLVVLEVTSLRWFLASLHKAVLLGFLRIFVWSPTHLPTVGPATSVTSNANCIRCLVPAIV